MSRFFLGSAGRKRAALALVACALLGSLRADDRGATPPPEPLDPALRTLERPPTPPVPDSAKRRKRPTRLELRSDNLETRFLFGGMFSFLSGATLNSGGFASIPPMAASPPESLVLDRFDAGASSGGTILTSSWAGQVSAGATSITVGGTARDHNGWGATGLTLDATGFGFITITAQRDAGHTAAGLFLQFEDRAESTNTAVFSIDAAGFALGAPTTLQIAIGSWPSQFDASQIGGWSIGGGGVGTTDFRMTLHHLELSASAIPEPATVAIGAGLAVLLAAIAHRSRVRRL